MAVFESREKRSLPDYIDKNPFERWLDENGLYTMEKKYLRRNKSGQIIETPSERVYSMAKTMAEVEFKYDKNEEEVGMFTEEFYKMITEARFIPAGRIWSNAGTEVGGLFNCYVLPVPDDLNGIYDSVRKAAIIHKNGGGTGYNFSELRPRGTYVQSSKGIASGPVSFIGQFDKETEVINSGNRRGANMGILDIDHPDILDFIYAKSKRGEMTNFNVSVGVTDEFMRAVENDEYYQLRFNGNNFRASNLEEIIRNIEENKLGGAEVGQLPKSASLKLNYKGQGEIPAGTEVIDSLSGDVAGIVTKDGNIQLKATYVFDTIAKLAWETADPGIIFLDEINRYNPLPSKGKIKATNPCGEQPLHDYDACNLGSINLAVMVKNKKIDYDSIRETVRSATRFMDNVNDVNKGPIKEIEETVLAHRRIGMGVMGWADMLVQLGIRYDSDEAYRIGQRVMKTITDEAKMVSALLATVKGVFPAFSGSKYDDGNLENKVRNVDRTTIAPTGTISMLVNVASGIEPFIAIRYRKNIRGGDTLYYTNPLFKKICREKGINLEKISPLIDDNHGSVQGIEAIPKDIQEIFRIAHDIDYKGHVLTQAAFQRATDNAVSKTINMTNNATVEDVKSAYFLAWKNKLKGITIYRDGSKTTQVLQTGHKDPSKNDGKYIEDIPKLPDIMPSIRIRQKTPFGNMHLTVVYDPSSGRAMETFGQLGKGGDVINAEMEAISRLSSMSLRAGISEDLVIKQLEGIGSNVGVPSRDGQISSIPDAYSIALKKFQEFRDSGKLGNFSGSLEDMVSISEELSNGVRTNENKKRKQEENYKVRCPDCNEGFIIHEEGCAKCSIGCGYTRC